MAQLLSTSLWFSANAAALGDLTAAVQMGFFISVPSIQLATHYW